MGPRLAAEVERQLLGDLQCYGIEVGGVTLDWSEACTEGHVPKVLGGELHNWSNVAVLDRQMQVVAHGWIEFVHGGGGNPLFVFWDLLALVKGNKDRFVKKEFGMPAHIWDRLPDAVKDLCAKRGEYDSKWSNDPLVQRWIATKKKAR